MDKKEAQFIDWLCGLSDHFPYFQNNIKVANPDGFENPQEDIQMKKEEMIDLEIKAEIENE
ncbi:MAG TPA: hypothetical protein ENI63_00765 [Candidatus Kaiserbacteria bacterium]|nr:hypothetical protein [Candidatus Kaiserbacteria bacterium]